MPCQSMVFVGNADADYKLIIRAFQRENELN